jgi:outer membrane murein-binding lipoprotein Lpp
VSQPTFGDPGELRPAATAPGPAGVPAQPPSPAAVPPPPGEPSPHGAPVEPYAGVPAPYPGPGLPHPVTAAPYPVTGAPYPVTGAPFPYPVTGVPHPYGVAPPPRRSPWIIALSIASGVLLLAAGTLGTLWFLDHDGARRASTEAQTQIEDLQEQVAQLESDLDDTEERLQRSEDDLEVAQACPDAVKAFIDLATEAALSGQTELPLAEAQAALFDMMQACGVSF